MWHRLIQQWRRRGVKEVSVHPNSMVDNSEGVEDGDNNIGSQLKHADTDPEVTGNEPSSVDHNQPSNIKCKESITYLIVSKDHTSNEDLLDQINSLSLKYHQ